MESALAVIRRGGAGPEGGDTHAGDDNDTQPGFNGGGAGGSAVDDLPSMAVMSLFQSPYAPPTPDHAASSVVDTVRPPPAGTPPFATLDARSNASDTPAHAPRPRRASIISDSGSTPGDDTALLFEDLG